MVDVKIGDKIYSVHEDVHDWMRHARDIQNKGLEMRKLQQRFFKGEKSVQYAAMEKEREFDALLAGKTPADIIQQAELFR